MLVSRVRLCRLLAVTSILVAASGTVAQERYRLSDDDTWKVTEAADPASPEGQLNTVRKALASGDDERAEFLATQWIERHAQHPLLPEAYILRGDSLKARRDYYEALFDYEFVARGYPGSDAFVTALERELEIAKIFASGVKRQLWGMRFIDASDETQELLILVQERLPGSRLAEEAGITLADFYFDRRQMDLATEMYSIFIENFPRSEHLDKARRRLIYAHLSSFKGPEFDASGLFEARTRLRELSATDPATAQQIGAEALITRIDESVARKMLVTAQWYFKTGDPIAAEMTIRRLTRVYPSSVAAADAMRLVPTILEELPPAVLAEAPDYDALRSAILGVDRPPAADDEPMSQEPAR